MGWSRQPAGSHWDHSNESGPVCSGGHHASECDAVAVTNFDSSAPAYSHSYAHVSAGRHPDGGTHADTNQHTSAGRDRRTNARSNGHANTGAYAESDPNPDAYTTSTYSYADVNACSNRGVEHDR